MTDFIYDVVISPLSEEDGGGYIALIPDLFGCMADGDTPEEAMAEARSAIDAWISVSKKNKRDIPAPGLARQLCEEEDASLFELIDKQNAVIQEQKELIETLRSKVSELESGGALIQRRSLGAWTSVKGPSAKVSVLKKSKSRQRVAS